MPSLDLKDIKTFLDDKYDLYNNLNFIDSDPIQIPHQFTKKEDIEIAGFLSATIAWGQRKSIINNATRLMDMMDSSPHDFIINHSQNDLKPFKKFVHRTFNGDDCLFFIKALHRIYTTKGGLENEISKGYLKHKKICDALTALRNSFLEINHDKRSEKHLPNILKKSAAKRWNMYLRWMVRQDNRGVDFGLWKNINQAHLMLPLDVHTGRIARELGLLTQKQDDWKAVEEITDVLKKFDPIDPIKYDFALFGIGINNDI